MAIGLIQEFEEAMENIKEDVEEINKGIDGLSNVYQDLFGEDKEEE